MSSTGECPYNQDDLDAVKKPQLVKMVQRQLAKWPEPRFNQSKATIAQMNDALLDPKNGFTTNAPLIISPHPPKGASSKPGPVATPDRQPSLSPVPQDFDVEVHTIRVYIEDCRFNSPKKDVTVLSLPVLDHNNCTPRGFRILSKTLVSILQESNCSIEIPPDSGGVKLSIPDSEEDGWKIPFVRMQHGQFIDEMRFNPEVIDVPASLRVKLFIDNLAVSAFALKSEEAAVVVSAAGPSTVVVDALGAGSTAAENPALEFLRGKLAARDGYQKFVNHRGRTVTNPDIIHDWKFAPDFKRDFNKQKQPVLTDIQTVLGIQSTWLANAQTAVDIIATYKKVAEVSEQLVLVEDPPQGSSVLLNFLTNWKKNHPA
ncbi:hypothetical protein DFH07DRAFT_973121 [Mycena maculata]|uniref:Uncharacterized protein n=1 Tax=Mycena maculata TaxID=230809 RepID=A0AAD7HEG1_9AGAR|nr:hypothetical protein DFH07DRAFT_973121 [Mycena maculata]